jgi:hypothetical protein
MALTAGERPVGGTAFLDAGLSVEASGWKGRGHTAILSAPETAEFYRTVARAFAQRGELALSGLWLDDRLVAFDLALAHANRYRLLKTGYDESERSLAPGLILRRAVIERCFDLDFEAHEFLGPDKAAVFDRRADALRLPSVPPPSPSGSRNGTGDARGRAFETCIAECKR